MNLKNEKFNAKEVVATAPKLSFSSTVNALATEG